MKKTLSPQMERARYFNPALRETPGDGPMGDFIIAPFGDRMVIVASDGRDWDECGLAYPVWEHVSVSLKRRCPTWKEMEWVRDQFWEPDELVLQFSIPRAQHISHHANCLHLWKPVGVTIPLPPTITVAPAIATGG